MDEREKNVAIYTRHAAEALKHYDLPETASVRLISLSENATFMVEAGQPVGILRMYLTNAGKPAVVRSELAWIDAIRQDGSVHTPAILRTRGGDVWVRFQADGVDRLCAMFEYVPGAELSDHNPETYALVGRIAAQLHEQVTGWQWPSDFVRRSWDLEAILGPNADWGDWRNGPGLDEKGRALLDRVEQRIRDRLSDFPVTSDKGGLVHCDLRAANLMIDPQDRIWVIDFDDSGFSWFLWDLCSTTTFIEHLPKVDEIVRAWLAGYQEIRPLADEDLSRIPDLVMLRRLHIFAWLGTHPESDLAINLRDTYCGATYEVAQRYLDGQFMAGVREQKRKS